MLSIGFPGLLLFASGETKQSKSILQAVIRNCLLIWLIFTDLKIMFILSKDAVLIPHFFNEPCFLWRLLRKTVCNSLSGALFLANQQWGIPTCFLVGLQCGVTEPPRDTPPLGNRNAMKNVVKCHYIVMNCKVCKLPWRSSSGQEWDHWGRFLFWRAFI